MLFPSLLARLALVLILCVGKVISTDCVEVTGNPPKAMMPGLDIPKSTATRPNGQYYEYSAADLEPYPGMEFKVTVLDKLFRIEQQHRHYTVSVTGKNEKAKTNGYFYFELSHGLGRNAYPVKRYYFTGLGSCEITINFPHGHRPPIIDMVTLYQYR